MQRESTIISRIIGCASLLVCAAWLMLVPAEVYGQEGDICWKDSYGRGVGTIPTVCSDGGGVNDAGLCYEPCREGYKGIGPVCWQAGCPAGFGDDGIGTCWKPEPYGRAAGYPWQFGDPVNDSGSTGRCSTAWRM